MQIWLKEGIGSWAYKKQLQGLLEAAFKINSCTT